jgi:putative hydrolase of the HAD superfamily
MADSTVQPTEAGGRPAPPRAVLLDALGTLLEMERPAPRLVTELGRRGVSVDEAAAERGFAAEIAYYLEHHVEGNREGLDELRNRCAAVLREALGIEHVDLALVREAMLGALHFEAFPDAEPALRKLRLHGLRLVAASNWDSSLPEVLGRTGLAPLLDGVISSADAGATKPAPELFRAALAVAEADPAEALHVGDSPANDIEGALALGMSAVLIERDGGTPAGVTVPVINTLAELPSLVLDA